MPRVTGYERDKTTNEVARDLEKQCKEYIEARNSTSKSVPDNEIVMKLVILATELLRWRLI